MSYIILRGRWFHIIVLNVHAQTDDRIHDVKDSFYENLQHMFDKFPKYHMKTFKPTIESESLRVISNDNGAGVVKFAAMYKNLKVKRTTM
jgi:hypothetical protein